MNDLMRPIALLRPLGNIEQMFWLKDRHMPYHFAVCAEIGGLTTVKGWRAALDMVQRRHPNFSVKIEVNRDGIPCFYHVPDMSIPLRIVASDDLWWEPEMERELATPFDAQRAPLVRAVLMRQAHRSVLILSAHHSIADTKSLIFAIRDMLRALSGQPLDPLPPIASLDALLPPCPATATGDAPDQKFVLSPAGQQAVYRTPDGSFPHVSALTLTSDLTTELRRRSRAEATTVHGALVAAAVEAGRQLSSDLRGATIRVGSAVDARTALGAGEDVALLSAGGTVSMDPQIGTFWAMARFARQGVAPTQSLETMSAMMHVLGQFLSDRPSETEIATLMAGFRFDINISNLGNLPIETRFGDLTFERLWGPAILAGFEGEQEIGVATVNGSLSLLHTSYSPLPSLLETMEKFLRAACS